MASGTGNLPHPALSFSPFAILTAEEMNDLVENIESLADGSGIGDGAVTPEKRSGGFAAGRINSNSTGAASISGLDFKPKMVEFHVVRTDTTTLNTFNFNAASGGVGYGVAIDGDPIVQFGFGASVRVSANGGGTRMHNNLSIVGLAVNTDTSENSSVIRGAVTSFNDDGFSYNLSAASNLYHVIWVARG